MAWTAPRTWTAGELVTAAIGNSAWRDNLLYLKDAPTFDGAVIVTGSLTLTASLIGNGTTDATSTLTGAIQTDGGLGVVKALWVGGLANVAGALTLQATMISDSTTDATSTLTGAIQTDGGLGVVKALWVGGLVNIAGIVTTAGQINITAGDIKFVSNAGFGVLTADDTRAIAVTNTGVTIGDLLTVSGFGENYFASSGTGGNRVLVTNSTSGVANFADVTSVAGTTSGLLRTLSQGYTTAEPFTQAGTTLYNNGAGGLDIATAHASGAIRFYTAASAKSGTMHASGGLSWGDATDPGATNFRVAGTSTLVGAVTLSSTLTAGGNIILGSNYLSGDGGNEGIRIAASGGVSVGDATDPGATNFRVAGVVVVIGGDVSLNPADRGTGTAGSTLWLGRNSNAAPAAGTLLMTNKDNAHYYHWPDAAGNLRMGTTLPTNANDLGGTVVGTQTSTRASKNLLGNDPSPDEALRLIIHTPTRRFAYKSGAYNHSEFVGIIADESPVFAMDNGRSFNPVSAFGYTVLSIQALEARIAQLEQRH